MSTRHLADGVDWCGAVDWDRRLFDALIPLPEGTSYNAYLVRGTQRTALLDAVDETKKDVLFENLKDVARLDYIVAHHAEQDHSGTIPALLARYPGAKVLATQPGCNLLRDLLDLPADRLAAVKDGETLDLGGKTLQFITVPWVHWPDTMATWLPEDRILFTGDFFGSHLATSALFATDRARTYAAAKRYYAEIMMPYAKQAAKNIEKVAPLGAALIAPSHGPLFREPSFIVDAWREWTSAPPKNLAVVAYVSMHDSTRKMAERLTDALARRGVGVERFDLVTADLGLLAMALVDASTLLLGTPVVLNGPHPLAAYAAALVNSLKPKLKHATVFGSYGWGSKPLENPAAFLPDLQPEILPPVLSKGLPKKGDEEALEALAEAVATRHGAAR